MAENNILENNALKDLLFETLKEQRRKRRWGIFFKLIIVAYVALLLFWAMKPSESAYLRTKPHVALIDVRGVIEDGGEASADRVVKSLRKAYESNNVRGIILRINSPGGSPVQASYIYNEIRRLKNLHHDMPVYAVCSDLCTSAAYYFAAATDKIYANQASLVGSIGALIDGFGFVGTMDKVGVERRLITAGSNKAFLDPFSPSKPDEVQYAQSMLEGVHQQFISDVKTGRGDRLKINNDTFSGKVWTGLDAKPLGLIDDFGSAGSVARDVIKVDAVVNYTSKPSVFDKLSGHMSAQFAQSLTAKLLTPHMGM